MTSVRTLAAISLAATLISTSALAAPPHKPDLVNDGNRWTITAYLDSSTDHIQLVTHTLCFYDAGVDGTHQLYDWVSTSFPDWNGRAVQEGDQIFMHGDYAQDVGHDGMTWQIVTSTPKTVGSGHWKEWREDGKLGRTLGFANAVFQRIGRCKYETIDEAVKYGRTLAHKLNRLGTISKSPFGYSSKEIQYLKAGQLK